MSRGINYEQVWNLYCQEISTTFEHLYQLGKWSKKQCESEIPELAEHYKTTFEQKFRPKIEKLKSYIFDTSPVGEELFVYQGLLEGYCWITVCFLASSTGFSLGRGIFSMLIGGYYAFLLAFFLTPFVLFNALNNENLTDDLRRVYVLMASFANGASFGCLLSDYSTNLWGPPALAIPVAICLSTVWYNKIYANGCREIFLVVTLIPALAFQLVFYSVFAGLAFGRFVWIALVAILSTVDLQVKINALRDGNTIGGLEQFLTIWLYNFVGCACYVLFASDEKSEK